MFIENLLMFLIMSSYIPFIGRVTMEELCKEDQENISKFFELFLSLILRGFDEMEMQKRLEFVRLFGFMLYIQKLSRQLKFLQ